jgi:ATP-binding cassette subfamily B protein
MAALVGGERLSRTTGLRAFRVLIGFGFGAAPRQATLFLLCGVVMALSGPAASFGAKLFVDAALARNLAGALAAAGLLAVVAGLSLLNALYYLDFLFVVVEKSSAAVNARLMALLTEIPGLAHHEQPEYLRELDLLREHRGRLAWMTNATAGLVRVAVGLAASLFLLARLDPVLVGLPLLGLGSFWSGRRASALRHAADEAAAEPERQRRHLFELATTAAAAKEVRLFGLAEELVDRHHHAAGEVIRVRDRATWQGAALDSLGATLFGLGYLGAIGLVLARAIGGELTPGDVVLTIGLAAGLNGVVQVAIGYGTSFLDVLRVAGRYLWLEDYAERVRPVVTNPAPVPARIGTGLELREVSFAYPGATAPILDRISVQLPAGRVVALVGENGAGKTTLVKLLCRFYEPTGGEIRVDGIDLRRFAIDDWRARVSAAFQDFSRFEFRLRETVGVGQLAHIVDSDWVRAALAAAGVADLPGALPAGLETPLGRAWPGGVELSGGQWQKLALARAFARPAPLLQIFDEPTAALDPATEQALFEQLAAAGRRQGAGAVTILVTHRFSTVRMADDIVVLDRGRIVEVGSHDELRRAGGLYAELYELQARTYRSDAAM